MSNGNAFKTITNEDIYNKLVEIEKISRRNQTQIKLMWGIMSILFAAMIAQTMGG